MLGTFIEVYEGLKQFPWYCGFKSVFPRTLQNESTCPRSTQYEVCILVSDDFRIHTECRCWPITLDSEYYYNLTSISCCFWL